MSIYGNNIYCQFKLVENWIHFYNVFDINVDYSETLTLCEKFQILGVHVPGRALKLVQSLPTNNYKKTYEIHIQRFS